MAEVIGVLVTIVVGLLLGVLVIVGLCTLDDWVPVVASAAKKAAAMGRHQHDGPQFLLTDEYGRPSSGAFPQQVLAWHTCKSCSETYTVKRYEGVDEFESHQAAAKEAAAKKEPAQ